MSRIGLLLLAFFHTKDESIMSRKKSEMKLLLFTVCGWSHALCNVLRVAQNKHALWHCKKKKKKKEKASMAARWQLNDTDDNFALHWGHFWNRLKKRSSFFAFVFFLFHQVKTSCLCLHNQDNKHTKRIKIQCNSHISSKIHQYGRKRWYNLMKSLRKATF